jgi:MFS family permease
MAVLHAQGDVAAFPNRIVETDVPARLDRLPWGRFHTLVVVALGITWILDGLEVTLVGAVAGALKQSPVLRMSNTDIGFASSAYLAGAVLGALFFGWLTDRIGRKKLFFVTLTVYLLATAATAFSWSFWSFVAFRFLTGAGIGGEYTAINSTIQALVPAGCADGPISSSTAASGWVRRSAQSRPLPCWTRLCCPWISAGVPRLRSARFSVPSFS